MRIMNGTSGRCLLVGLGLVASWLPGTPAHACGGFFCNQSLDPNGPPPVAQTAENVLFAMQKDPATGLNHLEAHVQIFYTGPADRFSWVVPVDSKPTLDVGTNRLFQVLDPATRPRFAVTPHEEGTCKPLSQYPGDFGTGGAGGSGGGFAQDAAAAADGGVSVSVSFRGDIGPYDAAVIHSTSTTDSQPLKDWLKQNMYYVSDDAGRLIDAYVKEDKYFVAIRLINGHTVQEIEPLVMRFDGPGPCVPLRLTAIAAIDDLRINLWVLADSRVVPNNYFEIKINPTRIDWFNSGSNYDDLVKHAADEAGGNAFVTDYVGPASQLHQQIYSGTYDVNRLRLAQDPPAAMQELINQQFTPDAALLDILRKDIPEPASLKQMGIPEQTFYNQLAYYWSMDQAEFAPFDAATLAMDIDARIVQPLVKAQALFDRFPKLSRLSTFISPEEMNVDPLFMTNSDLPDVPAERMANAYLMCGDQQYSPCDAPIRLELPDGQKLFFKARPAAAYCYGDNFSGVDRASLDSGPALQTAYLRAPVGEGAVRMDRQADIDSAVAAQNRAAGGPVTAGGGMAGAGSGSSGTGGSAGSGGAGGTGGTGGNIGRHPTPGRSGCAVGGDAGAPATLLLIAFAALRRRRR